jgi:hypothetical protein
VLARGRMANLQLSRDQQAANSVLHQVAILLRREVLRRVLQPMQDQQAIFVGQGAGRERLCLKSAWFRAKMVLVYLAKRLNYNKVAA